VSGSPLLAFGRYTALRLLLFAACLGVLYLLGLSGLLLFVVALLISGLLTYPLARRQRDAMISSYGNNRRRRNR
jgi:hypothetical protein